MGGGCAIPACTAGGIPACLAAGGLLGGSAPRGLPAPGGPALGGYLLPRGLWRPPKSRQLLLWTVCILLECIPVEDALHL